MGAGRVFELPYTISSELSTGKAGSTSKLPTAALPVGNSAGNKSRHVENHASGLHSGKQGAILFRKAGGGSAGATAAGTQSARNAKASVRFSAAVDAARTQRDRYESALAVQQISGVAPVTRASGKSRHVRIRWACRKEFRHDLYWLAFCSLKESTWARGFYDQARARGDSHALALRKLGYKLVRIIFRLWQDRRVYDEQHTTCSVCSSAAVRWWPLCHRDAIVNER